MISTILIPLDGSAFSERALPFAVHLSQAAGARLLLLHAASDLGLPSRTGGDAAVTLRLKQHLEVLRKSGIEADWQAVEGLPAPAILATARDEHADLIVMSTHGRGGIGRLLHGSVADGVLREADVPILLVPAVCDHVWDASHPLRVLVSLDGSLLSESALGPAQALAEVMHAELLLVRAIEDPTPEAYRYGAEGFLVPVPEGEGELAEARGYLEALASKHGQTFESVDVLADLGPAPGVITGAARRWCSDVIVMATHARTGLERLALGSIATKVLQQAHTPVLVVRRPSPVDQPDEEREAVLQG